MISDEPANNSARMQQAVFRATPVLHPDDAPGLRKTFRGES